MSNDVLKRDSNNIPVLAGVTDDSAREIRQLLIDPVTKRLKVTATLSGTGIGNVQGPASSTDNAIARWNGTDGQHIQDSGVTITDGGSLDIPAGQAFTVGGVPIGNGSNAFAWFMA
jgi:hypothetical protein